MAPTHCLISKMDKNFAFRRAMSRNKNVSQAIAVKVTRRYGMPHEAIFLWPQNLRNIGSLSHISNVNY
jgi:hypothetical protein